MTRGFILFIDILITLSLPNQREAVTFFTKIWNSRN